MGRTGCVTLKSGETYRYNASGVLQSVTTREGYVTNLAYTAGKLSLITDADSGRELTVEWQGDRVVKVTDDAAREVVYGYDAGGRLEAVTTPTEGWRFGYDATSGVMTSIRHPRQVADSVTNQDVVNTYTNGRVTSQTDNRFSPAAGVAIRLHVDPGGHQGHRPGRQRARRLLH